MEKWTIVEVLRHARHDWMNQLQLIKGNIALNKLDNVNRIMDEMIVEAQQESRLSNLKLPHFAEILLTFNWEPHPFQIDYEIVSENGALTVDDQTLSNWIQSFFLTLEKVVVPFQENNLFISFEQYQDQTRFDFEFNGTIKENGQELLRKWLVDQEKMIKNVNINEINLTYFSFEIFM
ncbi:Spo0B C-terminal domain-containing protein [Heyndrickxia vini]|uniref:Spo0B domain-containing protein n=1 Tax=Heyndrickxia vini TaxID=1476025 RepID=A0ABX7E4T3_9BACI|nr:Spo0B C-terminal domain-containing protein [Heyndrickxia vini]QQZ10728.1 Spo0B domain-containing protein [Heyndrickxia vini]